MPVSFQNGLDLVHPRQVLGRSVLEPSDPPCLSAIEPLRLCSVETYRRFQTLLEPSKVFAEDFPVRRFDGGRVSEIVGEGEDAVFNASVWIPSRKHEPDETHAQVQI